MKDIIKYLPQTIADYQEIQRVCAAENPEFDLYDECIQTVNADNVIDTASEKRISEYEKLLNAVPVTAMSLTQRRERIKQYLYSPPNYALQNVLNEIRNASISGDITYNIDASALTISISCDLPYNTASIFYRKLKDMIPCNMLFYFDNRISRSFDGTNRVSGAVSRIKYRRIGF